jgi:predicted nucleic acid-binding protein
VTVDVVLDAAAFDHLDHPGGRRLRALLRRALERGGVVSCAAVTLAEVCRGATRTRRIDAALAQDRGGQRIRVVPTDVRLAKLVGTILHVTNGTSDRLADAHVVAVCAGSEAAVVITSDPHDIAELASAIPGTRILTRTPSSLEVDG